MYYLNCGRKIRGSLSTYSINFNNNLLSLLKNKFKKNRKAKYKIYNFLGFINEFLFSKAKRRKHHSVMFQGESYIYDSNMNREQVVETYNNKLYFSLEELIRRVVDFI